MAGKRGVQKNRVWVNAKKDKGVQPMPGEAGMDPKTRERIILIQQVDVAIRTQDAASLMKLKKKCSHIDILSKKISAVLDGK